MATQPDPEKPNSPTVALRILQTTDLHGNLRGYDYFMDRPSLTIGLSRVASLVRQARAEVETCLLFDVGDSLQGTLLCDIAANGELGAGTGHPMITGMNLLKYDGITVGNHDFNYGLDLLMRSVEGAECPVVAANVLDRDGSPLFKPYEVLTREVTDQNGDRHEVRIGITGCLPPQTTDWDRGMRGKIEMLDMVDAVRAQIGPMKAAGADVIVCLAHTGFGPMDAAPFSENAGLMINAIDGIDVTLLGHLHGTFPSPVSSHGVAEDASDRHRGLIDGKPVVMPGFWGSHLGQVDLSLEKGTGGRWKIVERTVATIPVSARDSGGHVHTQAEEDPEFCEGTKAVHEAALALTRVPVSRTARPLHSFFSLVANDASVQLVARAKVEYVRRALKETEFGDLPVLGAATAFKTGRRSGPEHFTNIAAGPLLRRSIADLYFFPNTICSVRATGRQIRDWLEFSASLFTQLSPDLPDQPLWNDAFPGYKFDQIPGLTYQISLSEPPRYDSHYKTLNTGSRRIRNLCWQGAPVADDQEFIVATNSFRVHGTGFQGDPPEVVLEQSKPCREILLDYILSKPEIDPYPDPVWRFAPMPGATAVFETGTEARAHLGCPSLPPLDDLGDTPDGFARFRLHL